LLVDCFLVALVGVQRGGGGGAVGINGRGSRRAVGVLDRSVGRSSRLVVGGGRGGLVVARLGLFVGGGVVGDRRGTVGVHRGTVRVNRSTIGIRGAIGIVTTIVLASVQQKIGEDSRFEEGDFAQKKSVNESISGDGGEGDGRQSKGFRISNWGSSCHHQHTSNKHGPLHVVGVRFDVVAVCKGGDV